jgi:hypothetical protein
MPVSLAPAAPTAAGIFSETSRRVEGREAPMEIETGCAWDKSYIALNYYCRA